MFFFWLVFYVAVKQVQSGCICRLSQLSTLVVASCIYPVLLIKCILFSSFRGRSGCLIILKLSIWRWRSTSKCHPPLPQYQYWLWYWYIFTFYLEYMLCHRFVSIYPITSTYLSVMNFVYVLAQWVVFRLLEFNLF